MWILDAIDKLEFKKPFAVLGMTLGAGFLLLAYFFHVDPLRQPIVYALLALDLLLLYQQPRKLLKAVALVPCAYALSFFLVRDYAVLFAVIFTAAVGKFLFAHSFTVWKWAVSAAVFTITVWMVSVWQQLPIPALIAPWQLAPLIHGLIFGFGCLCSVSIYQMRKDAVVSAFESYRWQEDSEGARMARSTVRLYQEVRPHLGEQKRAGELEEFGEKMIHLCWQLAQITAELKQSDQAKLEEEVLELERKVQTVADNRASRQYAQALENKRRAVEQIQALQVESERLRGQITNTLTALENIRFAYNHQQWDSAGRGSETLEFLLQMAKSYADNVYQTGQAYSNLKN